MISYLIRRLLLIPLTLFFIILVNFIVINLAPGEPTSQIARSETGEIEQQEGGVIGAGDEHYLQFREQFGLTLPIVFNTWPWISQKQVQEGLQNLQDENKSFKERKDLRRLMGDQARFVMPELITILEDSSQSKETRDLARQLIVRGGTRQATLGPGLPKETQEKNKEISVQNLFLREQLTLPLPIATENLRKWFNENEKRLGYTPTWGEKVKSFFFETRLYRYLSRVLTLDFGTLRNDSNKKVTTEVAKRFKYSLTLSVIPLIITFVLCLVFGFVMAFSHGQWLDHSLNLIFLFLYALPIFVVAPFLIEKVALHSDFFPLGGFTSPDRIYNQMTSQERLFDVMRHIALPILAITYGTMAAKSRLARTAVLEVNKQDYVRTARAKGLGSWTIWTRYIGRNASITLVTAIAGSLGVVLGGSLIIETLFEIDGFGKFFYDGVVNRDYNVIMFSAIAGSFLTLVGYLAADIAYTFLDPRVKLE